MAGMNTGLSANAVKTALDEVVFTEYEQASLPQVATAEDADVFHQMSTDRGAVITEVFKGVGLFGTKAEEQDVPQDSSRIGQQQTKTVSTFAKSVDIPKTFFDKLCFGSVGA